MLSCSVVSDSYDKCIYLQKLHYHEDTKHFHHSPNFLVVPPLLAQVTTDLLSHHSFAFLECYMNRITKYEHFCA